MPDPWSSPDWWTRLNDERKAWQANLATGARDFWNSRWSQQQQDDLGYAKAAATDDYMERSAAPASPYAPTDWAPTGWYSGSQELTQGLTRWFTSEDRKRRELTPQEVAWEHTRFTPPAAGELPLTHFLGEAAQQAWQPTETPEEYMGGTLRDVPILGGVVRSGESILNIVGAISEGIAIPVAGELLDWTPAMGIDALFGGKAYEAAREVFYRQRFPVQLVMGALTDPSTWVPGAVFGKLKIANELKLTDTAIAEATASGAVDSAKWLSAVRKVVAEQPGFAERLTSAVKLPSALNDWDATTMLKAARLHFAPDPRSLEEITAAMQNAGKAAMTGAKGYMTEHGLAAPTVGEKLGSMFNLFRPTNAAMRSRLVEDAGETAALISTTGGNDVAARVARVLAWVEGKAKIPDLAVYGESAVGKRAQILWRAALAPKGVNPLSYTEAPDWAKAERIAQEAIAAVRKSYNLADDVPLNEVQAGAAASLWGGRMARLTNDAAKLIFPDSPMNPIQRMNAAIKDWSARYLYMGLFGAGYNVRNFMGNTMPQLVDGTFTWENMQGVAKWIDKFGPVPRAFAGIGAGEVGGGAEYLVKTPLKDVVFEGGVLKTFRRGEPFLRLGQAIERAASMRIYKHAAERVWNRLWVQRLIRPAMPEAVRTALGPQNAGVLDSLMDGSLSRGDLDAAMQKLSGVAGVRYERAVLPDDIATRAREVGMAGVRYERAVLPDDIATRAREVGMADELQGLLNKSLSGDAATAQKQFRRATESLRMEQRAAITTVETGAIREDASQVMADAIEGGMKQAQALKVAKVIDNAVKAYEETESAGMAAVSQALARSRNDEAFKIAQQSWEETQRLKNLARAQNHWLLGKPGEAIPGEETLAPLTKAGQERAEAWDWYFPRAAKLWDDVRLTTKTNYEDAVSRIRSLPPGGEITVKARTLLREWGYTDDEINMMGATGAQDAIVAQARKVAAPAPAVAPAPVVAAEGPIAAPIAPPIAAPAPAVAAQVPHLEGPAQMQASAAAESWDRVNAVFDDFLRWTTEHWEATVDSPNAAGVVAARQWVYHDVLPAMNAAKGVAAKYGVLMRDFALHNYAERNNLDTILAYIYPFHFWYTRSIARWAERAARYPALAMGYMRLKEAQADLHKDLPVQWRNQIPLNFWDDNPLFVNLESLFNPLYQPLTASFYNAERKTTPVGGAVQGLQGWGPNLFAHWIIGTAATGALGDPNDWVSYQSAWTRPFKAATALLAHWGVLKGIIPPEGINVERPLREAASPVFQRTTTMLMPEEMKAEREGKGFGLTPDEKYDPSRVGKTLVTMFENKEINPETGQVITKDEATKALQLQDGALWKAAQEKQAVSAAVPALSSLLIGGTARLRDVDEQELATARNEYYNEIRPLQTTDKTTYTSRLNAFKEKYPWFFGLSSTYYDETKEEKLAWYEKSRTWGVLIERLPPGYTRSLNEKEKALISRFYDVDGDWGKLTNTEQKGLSALMDQLQEKYPEVPKEEQAQRTQAKKEIAEYYKVKEAQGTAAARAYWAAHPLLETYYGGATAGGTGVSYGGKTYNVPYAKATPGEYSRRSRGPRRPSAFYGSRVWRARPAPKATRAGAWHVG
jgi:hypothetical protein